MNINPVFTGRMHVTTIKDKMRATYECETSDVADKEIAKVAKEVCPEMKGFYRRFIPKENAERLISTIENSTGKKLDIPQDAVYSTLYSAGYDTEGKRPKCSLFLHCEEKMREFGELGDCTSIDIYI